MDPLSLTASIIAVLGLTKGCCKGLEQLNKGRKAPEEIGELLAELAGFQALLEEIQEFVEPKKDLRCGQQLKELVRRGGELIREIDVLIQQTWPSMHFLKLSEANRQRVTVLRNGTRLRVLKANLRSISLDLAAALSLMNASTSVDLIDASTASANLHHQNSSSLSTLLQKVSFIEESTRQIQEATGKLVLPMNDYISTVSGLDLADATSGVSIPSSMALTLTPDSDASLHVYDGPRRASDPTSDQSNLTLLGKQGCAEWCSGHCHTRSTVGSPWVLKTFLGQLFVESVSSEPSCNEHGCRRSDKFSWKMTYHLPQFLMNRYLDFTVHHNPVNGPNLSVRMPRVVGWQHKLFSCGRKPVELFFERALSGQFGPPESHNHYLVKSMFQDTGFMEGRAFTTLHKIVLGFIARDLTKELAVSTASINDCDTNGRTALCWATIRDDQTAVESLLAFGASPDISDYTGNTCLHYVRSAGVCCALLNKHADIHARNRLYSRTALHSVCKKDGPVEIIGLLIDAGIDIDVRDADGETPLLNTIFRGFTAAAEELLERGANPNISNISSRDTAMHFAVGFDRHEILPLLLAKGADYIATNIRGRHVGHVAARVASARTIQILGCLNLTGLDLSLKDSYGNTAADYLSSRELSSQSEQGLLAAFAQFQQSCGLGNLCAGPDRPKEKVMDLDDVEAQDAEEKRQPPGAFPDPAGQHDKLKDEVWRDTVASFRCNHKSPCCYVFDAPRGVCSGVISYQSHGQVS
ncbi:MAG: hypothetical protein LQ339_005864 [Xanthoria mediterranea]|nr:MAG: hypothetical protein LQ339_005864 [Xanthoria mediterranea]